MDYQSLFLFGWRKVCIKTSYAIILYNFWWSIKYQLLQYKKRNVEFTKDNDAVTSTAVCTNASKVCTEKLHIALILCVINSGLFCNKHRDSGNRRGRQKDYVPTMWNEHFTEKEDVIIGENKFRVYFLNRNEDNKKPLLVLLHGGGYSALTWAHFSVNNLFALL